MARLSFEDGLLQPTILDHNLILINAEVPAFMINAEYLASNGGELYPEATDIIIKCADAVLIIDLRDLSIVKQPLLTEDGHDNHQNVIKSLRLD